MRFLRELYKVFLFTSIFIAGCAVVMTAQASYFYGLRPHGMLLAFVFFGTLCSYNFHWFLTPALYGESVKAAWSYRHKTLHAVLFAVSTAVAAYCAWSLREHWPWLLLTAFITFLYSAPKIPFPPFTWLRQVAVGKTAFLALAWTHIPFILPLLISGAHWRILDYLFVFNRFYLIYPICILFDWRDREADRRDGIRSLVTQLPDSGVRRLFMGSLSVFFASLVALAWYDALPATLAWLGLPGLLLALLYRPAQRERSDYFYYFVLDGLMALSSAGLLIPVFL
ncbi:UbiA prenyltransferase family protein [Flaviaesturariibacter terrae]